MESARDDPAERARALYRQAQGLIELGREAEAQATLADLEREFGVDPDPSVQEVVTSAAFDHAQLLWRAGAHAESLEAIDQYLERSGRQRRNITVRSLVRVYRIRADSLLNTGRPEEALVVCDSTLERFADGPEIDPSPESQLRLDLDYVQSTKVLALVAAGRGDEARALNDELLAEATADDSSSDAWLAHLLSLRTRIVDYDAPAAEVAASLEALTHSLGQADIGMETIAAGMQLLRTLHWWLLEALDLDGAIDLTDDLVERLDYFDGDTEALAVIGGTIRECAHMFLYHVRFARQRRNMPLAVLVRTADALHRGLPKRGEAGQLAATIALRRRLRDETVMLCHALVDRLADEPDPHLQQIRAEALLTEAEAWLSTLHVSRSVPRWLDSDTFSNGAWAAFQARASRAVMLDDAAWMVIGNTLMSAMVGSDTAHVREVAAELVDRYEHDRELRTRVAVAVTRLLAR